jgi:glucosamine-6-phosphate deaminase
MSVESGSVPTRGLTLGLANILESREVWLLVTGSAKADVLVRVVEGPVGPDVPATLLRTHPSTTLYADEAAAAKLSALP